MRNKTIIFMTFLVISAGTFYYVFVDTLSFTQIAGKQNSAGVTIFLNIFDFDTSLTRYDIYRISDKSDYWNSRMIQVNSIQDPNRRNSEVEKLLAEMMEDPSLKKIIKKIIGFGGKASLSILHSVLG